ncbi:MAG: alpha/beta fold hydrolase [Candidatus Binataceae bacterium]
MEIETKYLGAGGPAIVLVHGSLNDGSVAFLAQVPLAERWRLIIPNRRGYGNNPPIERVMSMRTRVTSPSCSGRGLT